MGDGWEGTMCVCVCAGGLAGKVCMWGGGGEGSWKGRWLCVCVCGGGGGVRVDGKVNG